MNSRTAAATGLLALAAAAIGFAAADTYVVVLALPEMMTSAGLTAADLQRAAPIISGFLLGYVAVLPLIGRISDLRGRVPVLLGCLLIFAIGSVITAAGYDLSTIVLGRMVQGIGGGGLIPPTLALIADTWPAERRGLPLGIVGAVQELGSVIGPLWGAAILAFGSWRDIFWLNAAVGLLICVALLRYRPQVRGPAPSRAPLILLGLAAAAFLLVMIAPAKLTEGVTSGLAFLPVFGQSRWLSPLALIGFALVGAFCAQQATAARALVDFGSWRRVFRQTDLVGAGLLTLALGAVIVTFASAEPETSVLGKDALVTLPIAAVAAIGFRWRQRNAPAPLVPRGALAARPAWGAVVASFFAGAALIAALVDIPFFARLTVAGDDQLAAAMVLLEFLIALPVGALAGGWVLRHLPAVVPAAAGMFLAGCCFLVMSNWDAKSLESIASTAVLAACGFGFGLAIAPVNAALLANTAEDVHGLASALLVVARMVGMLIGISALTTIGLRAFHRAAAQIPPLEQLCPKGNTCAAYGAALRDAGISQLQAVFLGAAVAAFIAATLSLWLLRDRAKLAP